MFEIGVISIVVLAVGYWVTLWLMGRHDDVLHGDFVHGEDGTGASATAGQTFPSQAVFPKPPFPAKPVVKRPSVGSLPSKAAQAPLPAAVPAPNLSERSDTLQTLLASIKQDLKDASQL